MTTADLRLQSSVSADIMGSGGLMGGGGKGGSNKKSDAANTLRSNARARIVELLGEGEIVGLVDGAKSIYFDSTPLQNPDGSFNFTGVTWQQRTGLPDQEALIGFPMTETPYSVNVEVKRNQAPPVRTVADRNATSVRVVMTMPSLVAQDQKSGSLLPVTLDYIIDVRPNGSSTWIEMSRGLFISQKTTSPYQKSHKIDLPEGGFPWDIRVRRITEDAPNEYIQSSSVWEGYTVIVEGRFTYPNSALVALELDAENFGSNVPARYYDVKGLLVQVPSNYNPETRTYDGWWDGTFKRAWTNNPAWVLYDLLTNNRYGLGEFIDATKIDKWGLYEIAIYCDQSVPDGYGGREARYTYNTVINSREEAFKVLQNITTAFRGMAFWSLGQVFAVADMPRDVDKVFSPANVIGGQFNYSGTAKKARHSVAMVSWNDPQDFYRNAIEVVQHEEALDRFGWRQTDVQAIGCTSRGQALRYGKWILDTEHTSTETVDFECSLDSLAKDPIRPGHIIAIADPRKAQVRLGGRVASADGRNITLDKAFEPVPGESYKLSVALPSGELFTADIAQWQSGNTVANLGAWPPEAIQPFANWAITGTDVAPRQYRVLVAREEKKNTFKITALFHDPLKYARVEQDIILDPIRYTRPKTTVKPPTNLKASESLYFKDGSARSRILLSWTPGDDFMSARYSINATTPDGEQSYGQIASTAFNVDDVRAGTYVFSITAIGINGKLSVPATLTFEAKGWDGVAGPEIVNLQVKGGGGIFTGPDATLEWGVQWPAGVSPYEVDFLVRIFDIETRTVLSEWVANSQTFTYTFSENVADGGPRRKFWVQVRSRDMNGREGNAATLVVNNPAPDMVIPDIQTTTESIFVGYDRPLDLDFVGCIIWQSLESGFDPLTTKPVYDGLNTLVNLKAAKNTAYFIRLATYDQFGKTGLNISPEQRVYVLDRIIDVVPPEIPTGLKLTTKSEVNEDGVLTAVVSATWDKAIAENFKTYHVEIAEEDGAFLRDGGTETPSYERHGLKPGVRYRVRVRALNGSATESAWSDEAEIVSAKNDTPPAPVTNFTGAATFQSGNLSWTNPADRDLAYIEIWSQDEDAPARTLLQKVAAPTTFFFDKTLPIEKTRSYWARTVNTSGTLSPGFAGPIVLKSLALQKQELANGIIDASKFANGLTAIGVFDGLPPVAGYDGPSIITNSDDGKLYRLVDGKWALVVAEVTAEDIKGLITDEMIEQLDAAKIVGKIVDAQIDEVGAGKLTGQIVGTQIADGEISTPKMKAGTIAADRLIAASITATQIAARSVTADRIVANSITSNEIKARSITAENIVAGSITGYEILANSVNADRLIANSITAAQIQAGAIKTEQLAAGVVTADKIGVGLGAGNLLFNSDFAASSAGFQLNWASDGVTPASNGTWRTDYAPPGMGSGCVSRTGQPNYNSVADYVLRRRTQAGWDSGYPCVPGQRYEFSAYVSVHRCQAQVLLQFLNATGQQVGVVAEGEKLGTNGANGALNAWPRSSTFGTAPAGAVKMVPICRTTWTGESDPATFWTGLYLGSAKPYQSEFSPWSPNSSTVIDGGIVATGSLHADRVIAGTITADKIAASTITGDLIAANTITGTNIKAGSITADKILVGGGLSLTTWLAGPDNTEINGGKISANTISANSLTIGARGLRLSGLRFYTTKEANTVNWDAGTIGWINDNGVVSGTSISAGSYAYGAYLYIYWTKGETFLRVTADFGTSFSGNNVLMATYDGYAGLNSVYGSTLIDGTQIRTGTIVAAQIAAGQIQASHIAAGTITADKIGAYQVTADKLGGGVITAASAIYVGSGRFALDAPTRMLRIYAPSGAEHVSIGNIGRFWGQGDDGDHGIIIRDINNTEVLRATGSGTFIEAAFIRNLKVTNAMIENATITRAKIGYLEVDMERIADGAVSQAISAGSQGHQSFIGVSVRTNSAKLKIDALIVNNPNIPRGGQSAGVVQIWWYRNANPADAHLLASVAANMWIDRLGVNYHGTTPAITTHQPGIGYHSYSVQCDQGIGDSSYINIIELTK